MTKKKYEIGEELEKELYKLEAKLNKETMLSTFTAEEQNILLACYKEINGHTPAKNCSGCFKTMQRSLINWLKMYPKPIDMTKKKRTRKTKKNG